MKLAWTFCLAALLGLPVAAQNDQVQGIASVSAERQRLDAMRLDVQGNFEIEAQECSQRFAVSDCMKVVQARRRERLSEIQRQEASLNDAQRRQRGAEQIRIAEEKSFERKRSAGSNSAMQTADAQAEKAANLQSKQESHSARVTATVPRAESRVSALPAKGGTATSQTDYQRKVQAFEQKQREREKRVLDKGRDAKSLPLPP